MQSDTSSLWVRGRLVVARDSAETARSSLAVLLLRPVTLPPAHADSLLRRFVVVLLRDGQGNFEFYPSGFLPGSRDLPEPPWPPHDLELTPLGVIPLRAPRGVAFAVDHGNARFGGPRGVVRATPEGAEALGAHLVAYLVRRADAERLATAVVSAGVGQLSYTRRPLSNENSVLGVGALPGEGSAFRFVGAAPVEPATPPSGIPLLRLGDLRPDSFASWDANTVRAVDAEAVLTGDSASAALPWLVLVGVRRLSGGDPADTNTFYGYHDALALHGRATLTDLVWELRPRGQRWPWSQVRVEPLGIIPLTPVSGPSVRGP